MSSWNVFLFKFLNLFKKNYNVGDWYMYYFWINIRFKKRPIVFLRNLRNVKKAYIRFATHGRIDSGIGK